jgi:hypothetical protein
MMFQFTLPRQARDTHRENSKKIRFLQVKEAIAAAGGKVKEAVRALLPPPRL